MQARVPSLPLHSAPLRPANSFHARWTDSLCVTFRDACVRSGPLSEPDSVRRTWRAGASAPASSSTPNTNELRARPLTIGARSLPSASAEARMSSSLTTAGRPTRACPAPDTRRSHPLGKEHSQLALQRGASEAALRGECRTIGGGVRRVKGWGGASPGLPPQPWRGTRRPGSPAPRRRSVTRGSSPADVGDHEVASREAYFERLRAAS